MPRTFSWLSLLCLVVAVAGPLGAAESAPAYANDFSQAAPGPLPDSEFAVLDGAFEIKADGAQRYVELPGSPLETFGVLFGPTQVDGVQAGARMYGTKQGRRLPTFSLGLNGAGGYRLQVSPAKSQIELFKGDELKASAPFVWESGAWTQVRLQVRQAKPGVWRIEGKAWLDGQPAPAAWLVTAEDTTAPASGRASFWGAPYAGTPIRFGQLKVGPATDK
jgi:hypothetical protein